MQGVEALACAYSISLRSLGKSESFVPSNTMKGGSRFFSTSSAKPLAEALWSSELISKTRKQPRYTACQYTALRPPGSHTVDDLHKPGLHGEGLLTEAVVDLLTQCGMKDELGKATVSTRMDHLASSCCGGLWPITITAALIFLA